MTYLLDTNACIQALNDRRSSVAQRILRTAPSEICLCAVVYSELCYGAYRSTQTERNLVRVEQFIAPFEVLPLDVRAARIASRIRAELEFQGMPIGKYDLLIAAIAIANQLTLVTHNLDEFSRIQGLDFEDWE